jgi:hypothetical protein
MPYKTAIRPREAKASQMVPPLPADDRRGLGWSLTGGTLQQLQDECTNAFDGKTGHMAAS